MAGKTFPRIVLCVLSAGAATAGACFLDWERIEAGQSQMGLGWARQIAAQVESLTLDAREKELKDPVGIAVHTLSQGVEPRFLTIQRISPDAFKDGAAAESHQIDRATGKFQYTTLIDSEAGGGIRIHLELGFTGFLGTSSQFTHDAAVATLFTGLFFLFFSMSQAWSYRRRIETAEEEAILAQHPLYTASVPTLTSSSGALSLWGRESKAAFTNLGAEIRDLLKQVRLLIESSEKSGEAFQSLRENIHQGISDLHARRKELRSQAGASGAGDSLSVEKTLRQVEISIEPWAMEADLAMESHQKAVQVAKQLSQHIQASKEGLLLQAGMFRKLEALVGDGEPVLAGKITPIEKARKAPPLQRRSARATK